MKIRGNLADYNLVPCSNTYIMLDTLSDDYRVYSRSGIAYVAFVSSDLLPVPVKEQNKIQDSRYATIIFQVNLKYLKYNGRTANRFEHIPVTHTAYREAVEARLAYIFSRITELTHKDDTDDKYLVFGSPEIEEGYETSFSRVNNVRFRRPYTLTVDNMTTLFKGTVTLADEYYGQPQNLNTDWTSMGGTVFDTLSGCTIAEAIHAKTKVEVSTINKVLGAVKDVLTETAVHAVQFGAYSIDYIVPPLGVFKIRPDFDPSQYPLHLEFKSDDRVEAEMASALGFEHKYRQNNTTVKAVSSKYRSESGKRGQRHS